jgi:hypothetical protein
MWNSVQLFQAKAVGNLKPSADAPYRNSMSTTPPLLSLLDSTPVPLLCATCMSLPLVSSQCVAFQLPPWYMAHSPSVMGGVPGAAGSRRQAGGG